MKQVFQKGRSGNPKGRPVGVVSKPYAEIKVLTLRLFDRDYWELKFKELHTGTCHPKIESLLLSYAYGLVPREVHASGTIVHLGPLQALQQQLDEATEAPPTLDVTPLSEAPRPEGQPTLAELDLDPQLQP